MTATEYAKQFENFPTYHKIAMDAYNAGLKVQKHLTFKNLKEN